MKKAEIVKLYQVHVKTNPDVAFDDFYRKMKNLSAYRIYVRRHPDVSFEQFISLQADKLRQKELYSA